MFLISWLLSPLRRLRRVGKRVTKVLISFQKTIEKLDKQVTVLKKAIATSELIVQSLEDAITGEKEVQGDIASLSAKIGIIRENFASLLDIEPVSEPAPESSEEESNS